MAQRAYWNGHIRLSLVTFPVRLHAAVTETEKIRLHKIERSTGRRIRYQNATEDQERVEPEDIVMGYEYEKGQYVPIEGDEIKKLRVESKHMIDLVQFTDMHDIDAIYFEKPYYIVPDGPVADEAFVTLRDSLRAAKKVALGQITLSGKERIGCIRPCGKGLVLETLRYSNEVRAAADIFREIPDKIDVSEEQIDLAAELIERKTKRFDPTAFKDHYQEGLLEIINAKLHHRAPKLGPVERKPAKVVNIMDALKRSLAESGGSAPRQKRAPRPRRTTSTKRRHKAG